MFLDSFGVMCCWSPSLRVRYKGSGGGTAGEVVYPAYLQSAHEDMVGDSGDMGIDLVSVINSTSARNPFTGLIITDPETAISAIDARHDSLDSLVSALDPESDWESHIDAAKDKLSGDEGILEDVDVDSLFTDTRTETDTSSSSASSNALTTLQTAQTSLDPTTQWEAFVTAVANQLATAGVLDDVDVDALIASARTDTDTSASTSLAASITDVSGAFTSMSPTTQWESFMDSVVTKLGESGVLDPIDVAQVFEDARASSSISIEDAVTAAISAVRDVVIQSAVRAYERRIDTQRRSTLNRFAGTMSDINAVQSSAYIFGMGIIESQFLQSIAEFDAGLTTNIYQTAFTAGMQTFQTDVAARLEALMRNKVVRDEALIQSVSVLKQAVSTRVGLASQAHSIHMSGHHEYLRSKLQGFLQNKLSKDEALVQSVSILEQAMASSSSLVPQLYGAHMSGYQADFRNKLLGHFQNKSIHDQILSQSTALMGQSLFSKAQLDQVVTTLKAEIERMRIVSVQEHELSVIDLAEREEKWEYDILLGSGSFLGALGGGTYVPEKPSRVSSMLGGALGGMSAAPAGLELPGAVLGGLAGLLQ